MERTTQGIGRSIRSGNAGEGKARERQSNGIVSIPRSNNQLLFYEAVKGVNMQMSSRAKQTNV